MFGKFRNDLFNKNCAPSRVICARSSVSMYKIHKATAVIRNFWRASIALEKVLALLEIENYNIVLCYGILFLFLRYTAHCIRGSPSWLNIFYICRCSSMYIMFNHSFAWTLHIILCTYVCPVCVHWRSKLKYIIWKRSVYLSSYTNTS